MKKLLLIVAIALSLVSCGNAQTTNTQSSTKTATKDFVEVLYFHGKQRCMTCRAIEELTKEVLNSNFAGQFKNGNVVLKVVDISTPDGEKIADKYEVTWSLLIIDHKGKLDNLTDMGFSYAKGQPEVFKTKLKEALNKIMQ